MGGKCGVFLFWKHLCSCLCWTDCKGKSGGTTVGVLATWAFYVPKPRMSHSILLISLSLIVMLKHLFHNLKTLPLASCVHIRKTLCWNWLDLEIDVVLISLLSHGGFSPLLSHLIFLLQGSQSPISTLPLLWTVWTWRMHHVPLPRARTEGQPSPLHHRETRL